MTKSQSDNETPDGLPRPGGENIANEPTMVDMVGEGEATPSAPGQGVRQPDYLLGQVLVNRYKVIRRLGTGGFGAVLEAEDTKIKKRVAVKVLTRDLVCDTAVLARFRQEAEAASQVGHENIVDITDFDRAADGHYFLVMEYLEGLDLGALIRSGDQLHIPRILPIVIQVCRALHAAHAKGVVHRDLKPANIYLTTRGSRADFVKILDFGISKFMEMDEHSGRLTRTGQIIGTPLYMAPEQACGEEVVDHRADIYSLGIILYELLAGKPPFMATNYLGIIAQHAAEQPRPLSVVRPDTPSVVEAIVLKAVAKRPEDRFSTMAEMEGALIHALASVDPAVAVGFSQEATPATFLVRTGHGQPEVVLPAPRVRTRRWLLAAVLGLLGGIGLLAALWPRGTPRPEPVIGGGLVVRRPDGAVVRPFVALPPAVRVRLALSSTPPGAAVHDEKGRPLGVTPFELRVERSDAPLRLTFSRTGYASTTLTVTPSANRAENVVLRKPVTSPLPDEPKGWGER